MSISDVALGALIQTGSSSSIVLTGVSALDVSFDDFLFSDTSLVLLTSNGSILEGNNSNEEQPTSGHCGYTVREAVGAERLLTVDTDNDRYAIETSDGDVLEVVYDNGSVNDLSFSGYRAEHVAAAPDNDGFLLYWEHTNGSNSIWEVTPDGYFSTGYVADAPTLTGLEAAFGVDFNGDGLLG